MDVLDRDVLSVVLNLLPTVRESYRVRRVCRLWRDIVDRMYPMPQWETEIVAALFDRGVVLVVTNAHEHPVYVNDDIVDWLDHRMWFSRYEYSCTISRDTYISGLMSCDQKTVCVMHQYAYRILESRTCKPICNCETNKYLCRELTPLVLREYMTWRRDNPRDDFADLDLDALTAKLFGT